MHTEDIGELHQESSVLQGREHGHRSIEMVGFSNGDNLGFSHHSLDYLVEAAIGVGTLRRTHLPLGDFDGLPTALPTGRVDGYLQSIFHPRRSGDPKRQSSFVATIRVTRARGASIVAAQIL